VTIDTTRVTTAAASVSAARATSHFVSVYRVALSPEHPGRRLQADLGAARPLRRRLAEMVMKVVFEAGEFFYEKRPRKVRRLGSSSWRCFSSRTRRERPTCKPTATSKRKGGNVRCQRQEAAPAAHAQPGFISPSHAA
jgi:hypothetical protein